MLILTILPIFQDDVTYRKTDESTVCKLQEIMSVNFSVKLMINLKNTERLAYLIF
jgi:hypothetical protein